MARDCGSPRLSRPGCVSSVAFAECFFRIITALDLGGPQSRAMTIIFWRSAFSSSRFRAGDVLLQRARSAPVAAGADETCYDAGQQRVAKRIRTVHRLQQIADLADDRRGKAQSDDVQHEEQNG